MIFCQPTKADLQPPLGIKNFSWLRVGLLRFMGYIFVIGMTAVFDVIDRRCSSYEVERTSTD